MNNYSLIKAEDKFNKNCPKLEKFSGFINKGRSPIFIFKTTLDKQRFLVHQNENKSLSRTLNGQ